MDDLGYDMDAELTGCEREVDRLEKEIAKLREAARDDALERWRIWEDGFKAGQTVVSGALINFATATYPKNPYTPPLVAKLETK